MQEVNKAWLEFLREQYPAGSRIRLRELKDTYRQMEPGSEGTLVAIDDIGTFHVNWDNGSTLGLVIGEDSFTVLPPETQTVELYMPLCADLFERNYYGDLEDEPCVLGGKEIAGYTDRIMSALVNNRMPVEAERGIMHWYHEHDEVERKVRSVVFNVEPRDGELWGVAECLVIGELKPEEMETLKEYITGQASDGWGEGFEQREIQVDEGELYIHLWNSDEWSLQTEEERFGPKLANGLPEMCFSVLLSTGELICIKRGVSGYYRSDWSTADRQENEQLANDYNEQLGVSSVQRLAMESGSMFGWNTPGADPGTYEQRQQMGGMDLG